MVKLNTFVHLLRLEDQTVNQSIEFYRWKTSVLSLLSNGIIVFGQLDAKTTIPFESDEGDLHLAS